MVWEQILRDVYFFKFVKVCFMAQNMVSFGDFPTWAWEECVFCCCLMKYSTDVFISTDGIAEFNCIFADFLFAGPAHFWEKGVNVSNYDNGFICFSLQFWWFLPHIACCSVSGTYMLRLLYFSEELSPLSLCNTLLHVW